MPKLFKKRSSAAKKKAQSSARRYKTFSLTKRFALYILLWFAALVFTQLLRAPASNIFFGFVNAFPIASLIYTFISRSVLKIYMLSDSAVTEKNKPFTYEFRIINESKLPYPFIDAYIMLPQSNSVRCAERCVKVAMAPSSDYTVSSNVMFRFRGTYEIGVCCFYVYDFFRMFRVRIDFDTFDTIYVLPRKLVIDEDGTQSVSDSTQKTKKSPVSVDKLEVSDIREYRMGDSLKSIHWNLSSKSEELIVRDYNTGTTDITYIFCDMSARFPTEKPDAPFVDPYADPSTLPPPDINELASDEMYEDMNEFCADGVVELTVASVLRELRSGHTVKLLWFDNRSEIGAFSFELRASADFDMIFKLFATAPLAPAEKTVAKLSAMAGETDDAKYLFILPTIDDATVATLCTMPCCSDTSSYGDNEVIVYDASVRFAHTEERQAYIEGCRGQLASSGLKLTSGSLDDVIAISSDDDGKAPAGVRRKGV